MRGSQRLLKVHLLGFTWLFFFFFLKKLFYTTNAFHINVWYLNQ